jgi:hypothetical protein
MMTIKGHDDGRHVNWIFKIWYLLSSLKRVELKGHILKSIEFFLLFFHKLFLKLKNVYLIQFSEPFSGFFTNFLQDKSPKFEQLIWRRMTYDCANIVVVPRINKFRNKFIDERQVDNVKAIDIHFRIGIQNSLTLKTSKKIKDNKTCLKLIKSDK